MEAKKQKIRRDVLTSSYKAGACHIGSALSCVDILVDLYYKILKKGDIFIFGKASGVATLYAILEDKGIITDAWRYLKKYPLPSQEVPTVIHSFGSLGHALPFACGVAYAKPKTRVYVLIGDAEIQEGTTYESALFARHHNIKNLNIICDWNGIQACGFTKDICGLSTALEFLKKTFPQFQAIKTKKGNGVKFMENSVDWHYMNLTKDTLKEALNGLA